MYALHDAGPAIGAAPLAQTPVGPAQQVERRAVESTEQGSLESEEHFSALFDSTAAVLQLVEVSAQSFAEMLEATPEDAATTGSSESAADGEQPHIDLYA